MKPIVTWRTWMIPITIYLAGFLCTFLPSPWFNGVFLSGLLEGYALSFLGFVFMIHGMQASGIIEIQNLQELDENELVIGHRKEMVIQLRRNRP